MEPPVSNSGRSGRKRRRKFEKNAPDVQEPGRQPKKRAIEIRGLTLVGRYVLKEFDENGVFLGKISSYDTGLYRVDYEDGDCEDLDSAEICQFLIADEYFDDELLRRRKKLDKCLEKNRAKVDLSKNVDVGDAKADVNRVDLTPNGLPDKTQADGTGTDDDADSYSNSSDCAQDWDLQSQNEAAIVPPPELPPSSGTVGLSEDCVSYLFSVYGFLRSFSFTLFLSPFTLDDLVGCLNCPVPNTLLDAIHVAVLRMVSRRLETLSSDGSELAVKCLRCIDWTLLDVLTWPVYIVHYLKIMKYINGPEWTGFCSDVLDKDYCTLSVARKLKVLQILCDDALETAEVRAEIDMREESEVGVASEEVQDIAPENGSGRVHQRYPRVSSSKDRETRATSSNPSAVNGGSHRSTGTADDVDRNSDECRLCGMDGMLLCCDGCPSAYHSRCIGVSKVFIPEGPWFCPECSISKLGPSVTVGTSLKGAEVFGSDSNGQVFMGTCNHLVVLKISADTTRPLARYYNRPDIPTVLRALNSCTHHQVLYSGICQAILKYWEIPPEVIPPPDVQARIDLGGHQKEEDAIASALYPSAENARVEDIGKVRMVDNMLGLSNENQLRKSGCDEIPIISLTKQTDLASMLSNSDAAAMENFPHVANCGNSENVIGDCSMVSASSITQNDVLSSLTQQGVTVGSSLKGYDSNASGQSNSRNGVSLRIKLSCKKEGRSGVETSDPIRAGCLYMGSSFKPHAYINHYVHGYFAASAAAYLAVFSSEENRASETHALDNPRKAISASISLQMKAFSSAAVRFFWPSTEKKLFEVPRERCGWCLSCQGAITSKKACLLNAAALNASRVATKIISGLRLTKNVESSLYSIAMYTLYLEESLRGLLVGPFQSANYRLQWRKKVELSSSCSEIKASLLELEGSLRTISLSGDWTKLVDDWSVKPSIFLTTSAGPMQKRGPGRPSKKYVCSSEVTPDDSGENSNDFTWWHGRKQSKLIFQRGILPHAMLKKAARRGGKRKIIGLHYADISDIPKRNRQLVWRAAVERSKNASNLALQVRYLDHHIRWGDLVRPEQTPQDSKGPETESSAFRNAFICDVRVAENKVMYGVVFGHQKHLPSRLMKSIIEKEETQDGKEKYWLLETRIPLYLIREYEQQQQQLQTESALSPPYNLPLYSLSSLQKKQLKASRKDLFSYLVRKRDNMGVCCFCASCQQDVLLKNTVKCNACEGYCHRECTMSSTIQSNEDIEYVVNCKSCVHAKISAQNKIVESPTSPLALQGQEYQNGLSAAKSARQNHSGKQLLVVGASGSISNLNGLSVVRSGKKKHNGKQKPPIGTPESVSGVNVLSVSKKGKKNRKGTKMPSADSNLSSNKKKKLCSLGLIWKKNKNEPEEAGIEFRLKNILMKGNPDNRDVSAVCCRGCKKQYDPCFMYIYCENCKFWYHAMVVELEESKLLDLVGFKCCKCRRIKMPKCPLEETGGGSGNFFELGKGVESFSGSVSEQAESSIPTTPMTPIEDDVYIELDDPLLSSVGVEDFPESTPENIEWNTPSMMGSLLSSVKAEDVPDSTPEVNIEWNTPSMMGPRKLPVRRQNMKHENDFDGLAWNNVSEAEPHLNVESKDFSEPGGNVLLSPHAEWDASTGAEDGMQFDYDQFNYEVSDFEPQTYFSFTELLEDDGSQPVAVASENMPDVWDGFGGETSQGKFLDELETDVGQPNNDLMENITSDEPAFNMLPCQICSHTEPAPELFCQNCGIHIHSHCSPWEELPQDGSWSCGNCRAWR